ncbi:MAG TPA: ABC transporter permease [Terriglobales bacterium]
MLIDILVQTLRTLWAHKLRSFLTMFGIAWGVGSLLLLIGLGEGFRTGNRRQLDQIGENVMFSFPGRVPPAPGSTNGMRPYYITYRDYLDVKREAPTVKQVAPVLTRNDIRSVSEFQNSNGQVVGTLPPFGHLRYLPIKEGRWLNDQDDSQKRQVAVMGFEMRKNLFPDLTLNVLGQPILLNGVQFTVVGILQNVGKDENNPGNARIYIPHSVMHQYFPAKGESLPPDYVTNLIYQPVTRDQHEQARDEVRRILARNHQFDYHLLDAFEDWDTVRSAELVGKIFTAMNLFLGGVGLVTLALGAIGIINIMLVSVAERTREIGVMKALGATNRRVLMQFFLEGAFLTLISGTVGIIAAAVFMSALHRLPSPPGFDPPTLVPWSAALSIGLLSLAGIIGGLYPARKAALLQPVEAMRRE